MTDADIRRRIADVARRGEDADAEDGWFGLETAYFWLPVKIVGVIEERTEESLGTFTVTVPLDELP